MKELFRHQDFRGKLVFNYSRKLNSKQKHVYGRLQNGLWWKDKEGQIPEGGVVMPIIVYSDETQSKSLGPKKFYPIYLTIGNIMREFRTKENAYMLLGHLLVLEGSKAERKKWTDECVKGQLLHAVLEVIFQSIMDLGERGVYMIDTDEKLRRVHPFFAYYIADWPEGCRVTLTMDGKLTKKPCHGCLIDCTNLGKLKNEARNATVRTHESVMNLYRQALNALNKTEKKGIARDHSFHPYENFFWRLPGCNIYLQVSPDLLHQYFLGMVKAYLESFLSYLSEFANGKDFIKRFDDIFRSFPNWRECRTFKNGVSGLKFVTADTMKEILFKLPLAVYGLRLNNKAFHELAVEMLSWYQNITTGELTLEFLCDKNKKTKLAP